MAARISRGLASPDTRCPVKPPDSSAPPMLLFTFVVVALVQVAWALRDLYLADLTVLVAEIGALLGYT